MDIMNMTFYVEFNYDKPILNPFTRHRVEKAYMDLRHQLIEFMEARECYKRWNTEFDAFHPDPPADDDDPMKDWGGTEYCDYIRKRQKPIFEIINNLNPYSIVKLEPTNECDIGGVYKDNHFYITLKPAR